MRKKYDESGIKEVKPMIPITVDFPEEMLNEITKKSKKMEMARNLWIRVACAHMLKRK